MTHWGGDAPDRKGCGWALLFIAIIVVVTMLYLYSKTHH